MKYNFIKTSDKEIIKILIEDGFELISQDKNMATFLNSRALTFEDKNNKIQYSNILTF